MSCSRCDGWAPCVWCGTDRFEALVQRAEQRNWRLLKTHPDTLAVNGKPFYINRHDQWASVNFTSLDEVEAYLDADPSPEFDPEPKRP